jgi:hypothetical protein
MATCTDEIGKQIMQESSRGICVETSCRKLGIRMADYYRWRGLFRSREAESDFIKSGALHGRPNGRNG